MCCFKMLCRIVLLIPIFEDFLGIVLLLILNFNTSVVDDKFNTSGNVLSLCSIL